MYPCNLSALPIKTNGAFPLLCCDKIEHNEWHLESAKLQAASRSYHVLLLQCHLLTFFTKQNVYLICSFLRMHLLKSRSPGGGGGSIYIYIHIYIYKRVDKTDALLPTKPVPCIHDGWLKRSAIQCDQGWKSKSYHWNLLIDCVEVWRRSNTLNALIHSWPQGLLTASLWYDKTVLLSGIMCYSCFQLMLHIFQLQLFPVQLALATFLSKDQQSSSTMPPSSEQLWLWPAWRFTSLQTW